MYNEHKETLERQVTQVLNDRNPINLNGRRLSLGGRGEVGGGALPVTS